MDKEPIKFDVKDLNRILGIEVKGLKLYTSKKMLIFNNFTYFKGVQNIYRRRDISDYICSLSFRSQLLPF